MVAIFPDRQLSEPEKKKRKRRGGRPKEYRRHVTYFEDFLEAQKGAGEEWTIEEDIIHFT